MELGSALSVLFPGNSLACLSHSIHPLPLPELCEGLLGCGVSHLKSPQGSLQLTTGSHCEENYHLSDAEGRKHAACEKGGAGENKGKKIISKGQAFQEKQTKLIISKTYSTQSLLHS